MDKHELAHMVYKGAGSDTQLSHMNFYDSVV